MVGELEFEGILAGADVVLVGAAFGIETGMKVGGHLEEVEDDNLLRQEVVEFVYQLATIVGGELLFGVEVGVERARVHAGVRAPAARNRHALLMQQQRETILQRLLHRRVLRLNLPAEKCGTVVCQMDKVSHVLPKPGRKSTIFL